MTQLIGDHSMKKSLLALAALGAFASAAHAQSSVTLYGIIDAGLTYVNSDYTVKSSGAFTGGSLFAMQSGILQGSRWGLKGSEDLGGGLKTVFQLENGFNVFSGALGQGSRMFGRQAYVGLSSGSWGTVTVGRQYDTIDDYVQPATMNGNWGAYFSHAGDIDNSDNAYRVSNSVKYASPSFNGLTFGGMYAFGGVAGAFGEDSMFGIGAAYTAGPVYLTAAYEYNRNPSTAFTDGNWVSSTAANANEYGAFGYVGANPTSSQIWGLGGTYAFGPAKLGLDYTNTKFEGALEGGSITFNNVELWGQYAVTPAVTLIAGDTYTFAKADYTIALGQKPTWNQVNLMADYALSKRTDIYAMGIYESAGGGALASVYYGFSGTSDTTSQAMVRLGIRTKF
jgi:predicted porin